MRLYNMAKVRISEPERLRFSDPLIFLHIHKSKVYLCVFIPWVLLCKLPHAPVCFSFLLYSNPSEYVCVSDMEKPSHDAWHYALISMEIGYGRMPRLRWEFHSSVHSSCSYPNSFLVHNAHALTRIQTLLTLPHSCHVTLLFSLQCRMETSWSMRAADMVITSEIIQTRTLFVTDKLFFHRSYLIFDPKVITSIHTRTQKWVQSHD